MDSVGSQWIPVIPQGGMLAVTDVTKLPLTFLTTGRDQASLSPPPSSVFVVSDTPGPFRSASLSLFFFHFRSR